MAKLIKLSELATWLTNRLASVSLVLPSSPEPVSNEEWRLHLAESKVPVRDQSHKQRQFGPLVLTPGAGDPVPGMVCDACGYQFSVLIHHTASNWGDVAVCDVCCVEAGDRESISKKKGGFHVSWSVGNPGSNKRG